jgi:hypothetical protein
VLYRLLKLARLGLKRLPKTPTGATDLRSKTAKNEDLSVGFRCVDLGLLGREQQADHREVNCEQQEAHTFVSTQRATQ